MQLELNQEVIFHEDLGPYKVAGLSPNFAVCTRPADEEDVEDFEWEGDTENLVVYTIVDLLNEIRGPNNLTLNPYDYESDVDIEVCLDDLESGEIEISSRYRIPVRIVNV